MVLIGLITLFIMLPLLKFLITRKYYRTYQSIVVGIIVFYTTLSMSRHLDAINTRTPNPDKALPYFIAIFHMLAIGIALMIAFHWYL